MASSSTISQSLLHSDIVLLWCLKFEEEDETITQDICDSNLALWRCISWWIIGVLNGLAMKIWCRGRQWSVRGDQGSIGFKIEAELMLRLMMVLILPDDITMP